MPSCRPWRAPHGSGRWRNTPRRNAPWNLNASWGATIVWGIVPAAGAGTRIQPLAFSKELLPVGSRIGVDGVERPRAVSEYLVERMILGGADKICFVVSPGKADILAYYGASVCSAHVSYTVQPQPAGLCDAIFRAMPLVRADEPVL